MKSLKGLADVSVSISNMCIKIATTNNKRIYNSTIRPSCNCGQFCLT